MRLRRSIEKADRELAAVEQVLRPIEADEFPASAFEQARLQLRGVKDFATEQAERLEARLLEAGGLRPGAVWRERGDE